MALSPSLFSTSNYHFRYNKPLQSSVRAVTNGTLWALKREDFRGILMSEFSNIPSLKLLRSVQLFTRLTVLQLSQLADSLVEVSFADGQVIVDKVYCLKIVFLMKWKLLLIVCTISGRYNHKRVNSPPLHLQCTRPKENISACSSANLWDP
mgnify:CR=1 FL=1